MRLIIAATAILAIGVGLTNGQSPQGSPEKQPRDIGDTIVPFQFREVYLGCQASQEAARKALEALPGVTDLKIDPAKRTILFKVPFKLANNGKVVRALNEAGLDGWFDYYDPTISDKITLVDRINAILSGEPPPAAEVILYGVFAGSTESQAAIRKALSPSQVEFEGDGPVKTLRIKGKALESRDEVAKLIKAGFNASRSNRKP